MDKKGKRFLVYISIMMYIIIAFTGQVHIFYIHSLLYSLMTIFLLNEILILLKGENNEENK